MKHTIQQIRKISETEGWSIFYTGIQDAVYNIFELQRLDEEAIFANDDEAIRHVVKKAIEDPKSIHASAIRFLVKESPNEVDSVIRGAVKVGLFLRLVKELNIEL